MAQSSRIMVIISYCMISRLPLIIAFVANINCARTIYPFNDQRASTESQEDNVTMHPNRMSIQYVLLVQHSIEWATCI